MWLLVVEPNKTPRWLAGLALKETINCLTCFMDLVLEIVDIENHNPSHLTRNFPNVLGIPMSSRDLLVSGIRTLAGNVLPWQENQSSSSS